MTSWALAVAAAGLLILTVPGFNQNWLAWFAVAPLFVLARREEARPRIRFLAGWLAGTLYWAVACWWIEYVLEVNGGMNLGLAWLAFVLFALYKGLPLAVFVWLAGWIPLRWWSAVTFAALWTGIEWTNVWTGFLWIPLGGSAALDSAWLMRLAPITGVHGIAFAYALMGAVIALVLVYRQRKALLFACALLLVLAALPAVPAPAAGDRSAVVVQPAMPVAAEWTREFLDGRLARLTFQSFHSAALAEGHPKRLIIWPEMPGPIYYEDDPGFHQLAADIAIRNGDYFLFGTTMLDKDRNPFNSAILLAPDSGMVGRYDKVNLVPFGEFVPPAFAWVNKITQEPGNAIPGSRLTLFPVEGEKVGVFICYESAYPNFVRQFAGNGATFFVNLSNDGYFGESYAREQHLALVRMRAAENRRWIIRATNNGITAVVDPAGRVTERMPEWRETSAIMKYGVQHETTFYSRHGDWFAWLCLFSGPLMVSRLISVSRLTRNHAD